jgi:bifunctional DNA-binding transcriptional regulator/antitoxin component of YhaV-PrlF toxin-antitoxin module
MSHSLVQIGPSGTIALPSELQRQYSLREGDTFTVIDIGKGAFVLTPGTSEVARLGDEITRMAAEAGVGLGDLLEDLDQIRAQYNREHYDAT